ncbi:hypothetical protein BZG01_08140 [Labilibaculum manganireducens]|uniref:DUF4197 domain-containing protein n=1 Tax=Labilibaculum manganireducens TaxID=1940525 RepID=A0A2N3IAM3_9BACT|nr:DUF4197 domain-containing protein [Labilibaculum manganireducens]PKQ67347.1 hypothetical protein BZG01_08140 [Labilibaculum manganireducens]
MNKTISILLICFLFASCAELQPFMDQYALSQPKPLSSAEVSSGLKEALKIGSKNASNLLSMQDGFYKDELIKILLPPEAQSITKNINLIPGGAELVDKVVLRLNRAAEDAVSEATPIFISAITEMTIADAFGILKGGNDAATVYLQNKTQNKLQELFMPKVKASLDKKLVANLSTNESWSLLTKNYNAVAGSFAGKLASLEPINTKLDEYVTEKALSALFLKVADEEKLIRKDPLKRVNDLLKRVFGELDK